MKKINRCISVLLFLLVIISLMPFTKVNVEAAAKPMLEKKSISMVIGETSTIKVKNAKGSRISYKTNKKSIAAVSQKGKVTGKKNGKAKITVLVKKGSKTTKLTYKVTVKKPKLSKSKLAVKKGSTVKLSIKNKPKKAKYTWSSSNKTVAAVNKNGKITAKSQGTATIKVKVKTLEKIYSLSCKVTVGTTDEKQTYTVIFDSNGGSPVESQTVKENDRVIKPADPVRSGYTFDGWFTALNGGQIYNFNTAITGNITLYAHWTEADVPTYTVTFDSNGGSPVAPQTVKENERVIKPADPTRSGYIFTGWYFSITGGEAYDFNSAVTENITLYANWINSQMSVKRLGMDYRVKSVGRYTNWAGISNVSQFADEQGRFCFAFCDENAVTVIKMNGTEIMDTLQLPKLYPLFGTAACDDNGNLYLVWGRENESDDTNIETIFVSKYSSKGELIATVGGNGSEGLAYYYDDSFNTKIPFHAGNCDVAINGNLLMVNYARTMYSGHQSNGIFAINVDNMTVNTNFVNYNSHSFDQRVTPFQSTGGFLIQSQGDCFPRAFTTTVTDASSALAEVESFHFWVQNGAYSDYNMFFLNRTYALLGNILDSGDKAALVGASARSLSENALYEPYDIFIQIFNPRGLREDLNTYVTSGTRSGLGGNDGNVEMTDYGVKWLTDFAGTEKTVDVVQAVTTRLGNIVVLYELYNESTWSFDSTWYMILDAKGNVIQEAQNLGNVRLNTDEDPVSVNGTVQWISNQQDGDELGLNVLAAD